MITAAEMYKTTNDFHGSTARAHARRIGLEHQIKNAASHGYFSIQVPTLKEIEVQYFKSQGFDVRWENSWFVLSPGHWVISWRNVEC